MATAKRLLVGILIASLGDAAALLAQEERQEPGAAAVLTVFHERVGEYAALHQRMEAPLPPLRPSGSARSLLLNRAYLAAAIKSARPHARQGDIFTPAVADLFKTIVGEALAGTDVPALLGHLYAEHKITSHFHPRVYDPFPDWATQEMPALLLQHLPPLPEDIEYRLVDHDLVLLDIHANLIVDALPDAIPRSAS